MTHPQMNDDWTSLEGEIAANDIRSLKKLGHIERLSITKGPLITARVASGFAGLTSVSWFWLWCNVTRTAMRSVIAIPKLKTLDVLAIKPPGRLDGFGATSLETLRAHFLSEGDLLEVAKGKSLRVIGAQNAKVSPKAIEAFLAMPALESLDIEATRFDDDMAKQLSSATTLLDLDIGATSITPRGLAEICKMKQLRSLDLWATDIEESDIDLLAQLQSLEYLSVGTTTHNSKKLVAKSLIPRLAAIKSLKRIWLDGVSVGKNQRRELESRYAAVRIT